MGTARDLEVPDICTALSARTGALADLQRLETLQHEAERASAFSITPLPSSLP
jgi:hypothetical protein